MYEEIEKVTDGFWNEYIMSLDPIGICETSLRECPDIFDMHARAFDSTVKTIKERYIPQDNSDLIQVSYIRCCCPECAKYHGRIYSLFGMDKRFPRLPEWLSRTKGAHCGMFTYPYIYYPDIPTSLYVKGEFVNVDAIEPSNRPFEDDRPQEDIDIYLRIIAEYKEEQQDRATFAMLEEDYPDITPKSYGAYRRMKKAKTKGYLTLAEELKKDNIELPL